MYSTASQNQPSYMTAQQQSQSQPQSFQEPLSAPSSGQSLGYISEIDGGNLSYDQQVQYNQEHYHPEQQQICYPSKKDIPVPSYAARAQVSSVSSSVNSTTNFYVPANTLVQVSCGDDKWSYGYWRDNHRAINVLESSLRDLVAAGKGIEGLLFVRLADVALNDNEGHPMYLASNRHRPCYVAFPPGTVLFYNATEVAEQAKQLASTKGRPQGAPKKRQPTSMYHDTFEPIDLNNLVDHLTQQEDYTQQVEM